MYVLLSPPAYTCDSGQIEPIAVPAPARHLPSPAATNSIDSTRWRNIHLAAAVKILLFIYLFPPPHRATGAISHINHLSRNRQES